MYIVIIGGGQVGFYLAKELVESNHEVLVIEENSARSAEIAETLGEIVMRGDGCEAAIQEQVGTGRADLLLAVTGADQDNLVACQVAKHVFNVPRTVARINNPKNEAIFRKLGIDFTVSATSAILSQIEQELPSHPLIPLLTLSSGFQIVEIKIPEGARVAGMKLGELSLPADSIVWGVVDASGTPRAPDDALELQGGEDIVVATLVESEEALRAALTETG